MIRSLITMLLLVGFIACKEKSKSERAEAIVSEWYGRKIKFPEKQGCILIDKDISCPENSKNFKILLYTDSTGCTSCKLDLKTWKIYMQYLDSIAPKKVEYMFYFSPKHKNDLIHILRREKYSSPVYYDSTGTFSDLNKLPKDEDYKCFLLNNENQVIAIGNPTTNNKVWELYQRAIQGEDKKKQN